MPSVYIINGTIILPGALLKNAQVLIEGGRIVAAGKKVRHPAGAIIIDVKGSFVSPGFIDTHIHGSPGEIFENEAPCGTTSVIIAESCASSDVISAKMRQIDEFVVRSPFGRNILGVRLEGPYISKAKAGAQDKRYIKTAYMPEAAKIIKECRPFLKMMTVAPEIKGVKALIKLLKRNKVAASIGHTNATFEEALDGISAGIDHATHTFNAMRGINRKEPGAGTAVLSQNNVTAEVIPDLIHVPKNLLKLLIEVKGAGRIILVTDSVRSEKRPGVVKKLGAYRFKDERLAGSALTTIDALKNVVKECGVSIVDGARMLTVNPAKYFGAGHRKGRIAAGMDADIVVFDKTFDVRMTIINGKVVYKKCAA